MVVFPTPTKPSRSLHTYYFPNEKNNGVLMVAMCQLQLLIKSILSHPPSPNTPIQLRFSRSRGDWKPGEAKFPTSQAVCSCHFCVASLPTQPEPPHLFPVYSGPTPIPGLTDADLSQEFWKTSGLFLRLSHPMAHSRVTLFLIPNFLAIDLIPQPL